MTETATLKVNVIETGANKVRVNIDRVAKSCEEAAKQAGYFFDKQGRLRTQNGRFAKSNDEVANSLRRMKKQSDALGDSIDDLDDKSKKGGSALGALKGIAASFLTFKTIENAVKMADTMTVLRSQVNLVTKSQEESITVQSKLFDISNRTYASLEATTTLYTRTARALQHLNKSSAETLKFTEAINNAMRLGGVSAGEQVSALLQLSQAMGSGVLQGDEFRSLAENAPILLDILSKHMGVMRGELKQMGADGKITSEIIFEAMTKASDELSKKAASMPVTFGQSMQVMNTHVMSFVDSMMNGSGIMTAVAAMVLTLAENIEYILVPAMGVAAVFAVKALTTAFMMLGGPMGIIAVVIGSLGLLAAAYGNNARKLENLKEKVKAAYAEIEEMSKVKLDAFMVNLEVVISHDAKAYKDAQDKLKNMESQLKQLEGDYENLDAVQKKLSNIPSLIDKLTDRIKLQRSELEKLKAEYSNSLDMQKQGSILQGAGGVKKFVGPLPYQESKEFLDLITKIQQKSVLIGKEGSELKYIQMEQNGELDKMTSKQREVIKFFLQMNDAAAKIVGNQQSINSMIESLGREAATVGMNRREIALFDAKSLGATPEQEKEINAYFDRISKGGGKGFGGSNPFTDRLKSLSEEAAKLQAINAEIRKYGEAGRYTALQEITLELENQNGALRGISATQKQMLLDQAALLDNQRQANEVLTLGSDYKQRLDDMGFELDLIGKTADEIDDLRFNRELEIRVRMIANGASQETIDLLTKEIAKIKELKDAYDGKRDVTNNSPLGGISDGFDKYVNSMGTVREQFATATESMFSGLTDAVASFASGADKNFSEMTRSVLQNISKMLIQMAIMNTMKMAFGDFFSGLGKANGGIVGYANGGMVGFANGGVVDLARERGGFTGFGSKYEPADIVHKGEVVWSQADVARHGGLSQVERMRKGFSNGGLVGGMSTSAPMQYQQAQQSSGDIIINITQHEDGSQEIDVTRDGKTLENLVKVNVKKEIANQLRSGGQLSKR